MKTSLEITICPTCGSNKIRRVQKDWIDTFKGNTYVVPSLIFHECPDCGEEVYDSQAMRKIEAYSPAYKQKKVRLAIA